MGMTLLRAWISAALIINTCAATVALAASDPYNSLRWNRKNHLSNNGKVDSGSWYEWWYYKVVVPETRESFYFVYGVVNPWDTQRTNKASRAWSGIGSFDHKKILEDVRPPSEFTASYTSPYIAIGDSAASDRHLSGFIRAEDGVEASWDIEMGTDWSFNAMGWSMFAEKLLNIYWYPVQASAHMTGWVNFDGKRTEFVRAPAYQDRNWGESFPKWWAWLVSNNFKGSPGTVLAAGGGRPKFFGGFELMEGMAIGLRHEGNVYSFRPNDGDDVETRIRFGHWEVSAESRKGYRIEIQAWAPPESFMLLPFTTPQGEVFKDYETLTGDIKVRLYKKRSWFLGGGWERIAELETNEGGIEFGSHDEYELKSLFNAELAF